MQLFRKFNSFERMTNLPDWIQLETSVDDFKGFRLLEMGNSSELIFVSSKRRLKNFAMKKISKDLVKKNNSLKDIQNEINMLYKLNHKNILSLHTHFEDKKYIYMIMEYANASSLQNQLKKEFNHKMSEGQALLWVRQIIDALQYLHSKGICHRNINTSNILMDKIDEVRSADIKLFSFNHAVLLNQQEMRGKFKPQIEYLPPEIILERELTTKVDIWGLGILIYELLTRTLPFVMNHKDGQNNIKEQHRFQKLILDCKIDYPKNIPVGAKDLLKLMLVPNPDKRISIEDIKHHWWINGLQIFSYEPQFLIPDDLKGRKLNSIQDLQENGQDLNSKKNNTMIHNPMVEKYDEQTDDQSSIRKRSNTQVYIVNSLSIPMTTKSNHNMDITPTSYIRQLSQNNPQSFTLQLNQIEQDEKSTYPDVPEFRKSEQSTKQTNESVDEQVQQLEFDGMHIIDLDSPLKDTVYIDASNLLDSYLGSQVSPLITKIKKKCNGVRSKRLISQYQFMVQEVNMVSSDKILQREQLQHQEILDGLKAQLKSKQNEQSVLHQKLDEYSQNRMIIFPNLDSEPQSRNSLVFNKEIPNDLQQINHMPQMNYDRYDMESKQNYLKILLKEIPKQKCQRSCLKNQLSHLNQEIKDFELNKQKQENLIQQIADLQEKKEFLQGHCTQFESKIDEYKNNKQYMAEQIIEIETVVIIENFLEELETKYSSKFQSPQNSINNEQLLDFYSDCDNFLTKNTKSQQSNNESFLNTSMVLDMMCYGITKQKSMEYKSQSELKGQDLTSRYADKQQLLEQNYNNYMQQLQQRIINLERQKETSSCTTNRNRMNENDIKLQGIQERRQKFIQQTDIIKQEENSLILEIQKLDWQIGFIQDETLFQRKMYSIKK